MGNKIISIQKHVKHFIEQFTPGSSKKKRKNGSKISELGNQNNK